MSTITGRWDMWRDTLLAALNERPLIGHGRGSFEHDIRHYSFHPHNLPVQLLYKWGLIGTMALFYLFLAGAKRARGWTESDGRLAMPALGAITLLFMLSGVDGPFFSPTP